jgi:hypothetical protein
VLSFSIASRVTPCTSRPARSFPPAFQRSRTVNLNELLRLGLMAKPPRSQLLKDMLLKRGAESCALVRYVKTNFFGLCGNVPVADHRFRAIGSDWHGPPALNHLAAHLALWEATLTLAPDQAAPFQASHIITLAQRPSPLCLGQSGAAFAFP